MSGNHTSPRHQVNAKLHIILRADNNAILTHDCTKAPRPRHCENKGTEDTAGRVARALRLIGSPKDEKRASMSKTSLHEQIATALVDNAVNDGFLISINHGEKTIVNRSRNSNEIIEAMFHADMDTLTLNVEERRVGIITLKYDTKRSGIDVIGDHTDIPHINRLVEHTIKDFKR